MNDKKLLGILPSYSGGGAEKVMLTYFDKVRKKPLSLKLFVSNKIGPKITNYSDVIECSYKRFLYSVPTLLKAIKKNEIDVLLSTFPHISLILIITKIFKLHKCNIVVRQPNMLQASLSATLKLRIIRFLYVRFINFADIIIVTSEAMKKEAENYKIDKNKIYLLSNPINITKIRKKTIPVRKKGKGLKLVFVGRLNYQKGIDRVIKVFSKIRNIEYLVIGDGDQKAYLENLCSKFNLNRKVTFYGYLKNPYNIIAGADFFLLPSRWEGMPNCVLESLSLGTPVITFDNLAALKDLSFNIKNKTIIMIKNNNELLSLLKSTNPRKDALKPKLRENLLLNSCSEKKFRNTLDNIILNILCQNPQK